MFLAALTSSDSKKTAVSIKKMGTAAFSLAAASSSTAEQREREAFTPVAMALRPGRKPHLNTASGAAALAAAE